MNAKVAISAATTAVLLAAVVLSFFIDWAIDTRGTFGVKVAGSRANRDPGFYHAQSSSAIWDIFGVVVAERQVYLVYTRDSFIHRSVSDSLGLH